MVLSKLKKGCGNTRIYQDLEERVSMPTIKRYRAMYNKHGAIVMKRVGRPRTVCTPENVDRTVRLIKTLNSQRKVSAKNCFKKEKCRTGLSSLKDNHADMLTGMQLDVELAADELFNYDLFDDFDVYT